MRRIINIILLLTFLMGYLEWGKGSHLFIFQAEAEILWKAVHSPKEIFHPFILIPFFGQIMILYTIFQKQPSRTLSLAGLACLSTIMLLLFFIGIYGPNYKILGSTIPFLFAGIFVLRHNWKKTTVVS